jgi:hypothetical protein
MVLPSAKHAKNGRLGNIHFLELVSSYDIEAASELTRYFRGKLFGDNIIAERSRANKYLQVNFCLCLYRNSSFSSFVDVTGQTELTQSLLNNLYRPRCLRVSAEGRSRCSNRRGRVGSCGRDFDYVFSGMLVTAVRSAGNLLVCVSQ